MVKFSHLLLILCLLPCFLFFVFAASNCRHTANTKSKENIFHYRKENFKASCFSVPDRARTQCCTLTISAKGWRTFQTRFVVMGMVMYVREVHVLPPPSDSENPIRIHQPRGRARTVWGRRHKPHAINCDPVPPGQATVLKSRYCGRDGVASARHAR